MVFSSNKNIDKLKLEKENRMLISGLVPIDINDKAEKQLYEQLYQVQQVLNDVYHYEVISKINMRIKSSTSIINKMKKKQYKLNYTNLINNINDIAGIRIVCSLKNDIYTVINVIEKILNIKVLKKKDYITKPKKSGYSGYHLIVEVPVKIENKKIFVKVEIQLRTMAMDFWATNEHKMKYKTNKPLSSFDSKKLTIYAKILNILDDKIMKLYQKQSRKTSYI